MSAVDMRADLQSWMEKVDESFLSAMHAMVETYVKKQVEEDAIIGYDLDGKAKYAHQMKAIYDEQVRAAKEEGKYYTLEEVEKEAATW
ncbi:MAG: hypothetical protein AAF741_05555 [Bacteroidota bacterium]